jgi:hypothetical protein
MQKKFEEKNEREQTGERKREVFFLQTGMIVLP